MIYSSLLFRERERIFHPLYLVHFCRCCLTSLIPTYENITSDADSALCYCGMCVRFRTWITTTRVKLSRSTKQQEKIHCRFYFIFLLGFFFRKRVKYFRINACNMPWDHSLYFCQFVWRWMETFSCETEMTKMMMMMAGGREELSTIRLGSAAVTLMWALRCRSYVFISHNKVNLNRSHSQRRERAIYRI